MKAQAKAQLNKLRVSPRKVRLIADLIRGMGVHEARAQLMFSKKAAARPVLKLLQSAMANAEHNIKMKRDGMKIETIFVNEGATLKRWMPRAMGRATPIRKRTSHVTMILSGELDEVTEPKKESKPKAEKVEKVAKKTEKKPAAKKATTKKKPTVKKSKTEDTK